MNTIVTKDTMLTLLATRDRRQVIGRALVALFRRQTADEQNANLTMRVNHVGFSSSDARSGTLCAKYFLKHGTLQDWQVDKWMRIEKGVPRIVKYHRQLNEIALQKRGA